MTPHTNKRTTDAMDAGDASPTENSSTGAAAAIHDDRCNAGEVVMRCQIMDGERQTVTRAELDSALEGVLDADDRLRRLKRRTFWGLAWRRAIIVVLLLLYAFEVWRQAQ